MSKYQFTPQAVGDLLDIWSFIAQDSPEAADRVEAAIFRACDLLADSPLQGKHEEGPHALASSVLGFAALLEVPDSLRSGEEATRSNPNSPRGTQSAFLFSLSCSG
jgi:plasmid stabilization system protein ParE